ncbi:MAG: hypothetical protein M0C28_20710 [Candidatus Moduliflexus flocculans]|nr:hypothetical protein [Candidatus Moduliflexus flocculans]
MTDAEGVLDVGSKLAPDPRPKPRAKASTASSRARSTSLGRDVYRGIGLSEKELRVSRPKVADVTTSSMEAYKIFMKGLEETEPTRLGERRPLSREGRGA